MFDATAGVSSRKYHSTHVQYMCVYRPSAAEIREYFQYSKLKIVLSLSLISHTCRIKREHFGVELLIPFVCIYINAMQSRQMNSFIRSKRASALLTALFIAF